MLHHLNTSDLENLRRAGAQVRHAILSVELPRDLEAEIIEAYDQLFGGTGHPLDVAVRSAQQQKTYPTQAWPVSKKLI